MFGFEMNILRFFEGIRSEGLNQLVEYITMLGEETLLVILIMTIWFAFDKRTAQKLALVSVASLSVNSVIKCLARVPRPFASGEITCVRPETATGYSFPSGHTQTFATWSSLVALLLKKKWISAIVSVMIVLVALSRMYLGAHYPSDVVVGAALGVGFAFLGSRVFDRVADKRKLCLGMTALLTPFAVYFMLRPDPLYSDLFKTYGMMAGMILAIHLEERFAPLIYDVVWWKKVVRIVIGTALALAVKEGGKLLKVVDAIQFSLFIDALRYFALVAIAFGVGPVLFKKFRL